MHGVKQSCRNKDGDTAMDIAEKRNHNLCRAFLQRHELRLHATGASIENSEQVGFSGELQPISDKDLFERCDSLSATTTGIAPTVTLTESRNLSEMEFGSANSCTDGDETNCGSVMSESENGDD